MSLIVSSSSTIDKMFEITHFIKKATRFAFCFNNIGTKIAFKKICLEIFVKNANFVPIFLQKSVNFAPIFVKSVNQLKSVLLNSLWLAQTLICLIEDKANLTKRLGQVELLMYQTQ